MFSDLRLRIATAVVLIPIALFCVWQGGIATQLFVSFVGAALIIECNALLAGKGLKSRVVVVVAYFLALVWLPLSGAALVGGFSAGVVALAVLALNRREGYFALLVAFVYCGGFALAFQQIRADSTLGLITVVFLFAVVWTTDVAAYFTGRMIGGPKLWPAVSPSKTWSGSIGGTVAAMAISLTFLNVVSSTKIVHILVLAAALSIAAQFGDLLESTLKRRAGVKDSGNILPGHGGVFDRADGLIGATHLLFLIASVVYIGTNPSVSVGEAVFAALR
jgi:phosphatidate cytidylyltransferase